MICAFNSSTFRTLAEEELDVVSVAVRPGMVDTNVIMDPPIVYIDSPDHVDSCSIDASHIAGYWARPHERKRAYLLCSDTHRREAGQTRGLWPCHRSFITTSSKVLDRPVC